MTYACSVSALDTVVTFIVNPFITLIDGVFMIFRTGVGVERESQTRIRTYTRIL